MEQRLGRYELRRPIGRGGAGTVYEAWDTMLTRRVAIKVVRPGDKDDLELSELLIRFRQEAQVAGRLSHAGVVQVYDYGESDGVAFIVMEFVEGETLKALLDRGQLLPLPQVAEIMRGVLLALDQCHRQSIVHRDIKPSNIMLPATGGVKLADFGIARIENSELTIVGTVMGTPPYMSPEQFTGTDAVDVQSDVWSSGVMLYEMLTGQRPFTGNTMAQIGQSVVNDPLEPPTRRVAGLPMALDQVLLRALRKSPAERFPTAGAFAQALEAALTQAGGGGGETVRPRPGGGKKLALGGIIALVLLAGAGATAWLTYVTPHKDTTPSGNGTNVVPPEPVPPPKETRSLASRVAALPCSTISVAGEGPQTVSVFRGIIGSGGPRDTFDAIIAPLPPASVRVQIQTFPQTDQFCRLAELVHAYAGVTGPSGVSLSTRDGRTSLLDGEDIRLRLRMPDFPGEVRLLDFNNDGEVTHIMEANLGAPPHYQGGVSVGLGRDGDDLIGRVSPPYGTDILVTVIASEPLFAARRPIEEASGPFIEALEPAMAALRRRGGHVVADALVLTTSRR